MTVQAVPKPTDEDTSQGALGDTPSNIVNIGEQALSSSIERVRASLRRTVLEVVETGRGLIEIQETLTRYNIRRSFAALCREKFSMDERVARRYIDSARAVASMDLFTGRPEALDQITPTVLYRLLDKSLDVAAVEEALNRSGGKQVTPAQVQRIMAELKPDAKLEEDLANAQEEASQARRALTEYERVKDAAELKAARMSEAADLAARNLQHAQDDLAQAQVELQDLLSRNRELDQQLQNPTVIEREVPVIPKGFKSIDEAIRAKEKELAAIETRVGKAEAAAADAQTRLAALQGQHMSASASADVLSAFRADIQGLCAKYPMALAALASAKKNAAIVAEVKRIASHLRQLADQLEKGE